MQHGSSQPPTSAGLLRPLATELADTGDLLGCSAALALLGELAARPGAGALAGEFAPQLDALLVHAEPLLRCQAVRVRAGRCPCSPPSLCSQTEQ